MNHLLNLYFILSLLKNGYTAWIINGKNIMINENYIGYPEKYMHITENKSPKYINLLKVLIMCPFLNVQLLLMLFKNNDFVTFGILP